MKKIISIILIITMLISTNCMLVKSETTDFETCNDACVGSETIISSNQNTSFETMKISSDAEIDVKTSSEEFINRLLTSTEFTLKGTVTVNNKRIDINEYYDFDSAYKLDIVDWAKEIGLITEAEKIETYCDLILDGEDDGVDCWNPYNEQIIAYTEQNKLSNELSAKIDAVLSSTGDSVGIASETSYNRTFYYTDNFAIEYNSGAVSISKIVSVGQYFELVRTFYKNQGYKDVILQNDSDLPQEQKGKYFVYIYTEAEDDKGGADCKRISDSDNDGENDNLRICSSYINIYSFSTLSNRVKQNISHEYFHAIQNSYNWHESWFKEATANWAMIWYDKSIPLSNTNVNRLQAFLDQNTPLDGYTTFEAGNESYGHGKVFFPLAIHKKFGADKIRLIYEAYATYNNNNDNKYIELTYSDIRTIISTGIGTANGGFDRALRAMASYNVDPGRWYGSLYDYADDFVNIRAITLMGSVSYTFGIPQNPKTLLHSTSTYYIYELDPTNLAGYDKVTIELTFLNDTNSRGRCQLYVENNDGTCTISYPTISNSSITFTSGDISDGKVFGIIVTSVVCNYPTNDYGSELPLKYTVTVTATN